MEKAVAPILPLAVCQLIVIANWKIGHSKQLFNVYYGGMIQSIEEHSRIFHCFSVRIKDLHARLCQMLLINLEKHLVLLGKDWRQKHDKYFQLLK